MSPNFLSTLDSASSLGLVLFSCCLYGGAAVWIGAHLAGWLAPPPWQAVAWSEPTTDAAAERIAAAHWFGAPRPPVPPSLQLSGVFAVGKPDGAGFAIAEVGGRLQWLAAGTEVDGWQVAHIAADGIELARGPYRHFYPLSMLPAASDIIPDASGDMPPLPDSSGDAS